MKTKSQLRAKITFLPPESGGFSRPHSSGVKPQLKVGDLFTSCFVWAAKDDQVFEPGITYDVDLELPSWAQYGTRIYVGMPVELRDGTRIVATGRVDAILAQ